MSILALTCHLFYNLTQNNRIITKFVESFANGKNAHSNRLFDLRPELKLIDIEAHHFEPKLVACSVEANQDQMQRLLTLHPELAAKKHLFTDWSGRSFNCSVFEYAFWTKDIKYMCPMILDCLPKNEDGEKIRIELKNQAQEILANGLTYQLKGKQYQEKFFSLEPLKHVLKTYADNYDDWDWPQRVQHCCIEVGAEQLLLPAYIRQHYCEESFYSKPNFTKEQFTRSLTFINWDLGGTEQIWDSELIGLGVDFALTAVRGSAEPVKHMRTGASQCALAPAVDLANITALDKVRTEIDLPLLMQRLENPLYELATSLESQYGIS